MANKIMKIDPAMLKFTLRGRGLSDAQLDAAAERLGNMKEAIKEGVTYYKNHKTPSQDHLIILDDDKFDKLDISYMQYKGNGRVTSTINEASKVLRMANKHRKDVEAGRADYEYSGPLIQREVGTTDRELLCSVIKKKLGNTANMLKNIHLDGKTVKSVDDLTNSSHGGSAQFDNMVKAIKELDAYRKAMYKKEFDDQLVTSEQYMKTRFYQQQLAETTDIYLQKKMKERGAKTLDELVGKNDYEKARISYAKMLKNFSGRYQLPELTDHQKDILKENDESSTMELNKKMKAEALKIQKENPQKASGPVMQ